MSRGLEEARAAHNAQAGTTGVRSMTALAAQPTESEGQA